jgi:CO/xanthine dehydrogenase Mo-binding subunit
MKEKISSPIKRIESEEKSGGHATYIADLKFEGMLHAVTLRSPKPRALIKAVILPDIPKGYWIVDRNDVPGRNRVKMLVDDQPFFADGVVNYVGEPILLVVGPEKETVVRILESIQIRYEDLEPVLTVEDSLDPGIPPIFESNNKFAEYEIRKGDPESAFRDASEIFEREYSTGCQEHIYIEPQGMTGTYENGRVTVYGSIQCPFYVKAALVQGLGYDEDRIRVVQTTTGGAFGGKEEYPSIIAGHVAFASLKTGQPVKLIFDRDEDIRSTTKRHPSVIGIRTALGGNREITAMEIDITLDGGAYCGLSSVVLQRAMFAATGVYNIRDVLVRGKALATNNVPSGAFRGFGGPQAIFGIEMHMDALASHLGKDPLAWKQKHILKEGDLTVTGGKINEEVKLPEIIGHITRMSDYGKKRAGLKKNGVRALRGIGTSLFLHGCAFTGSGEKDKIKAKVRLKRDTEGRVEILVSNVEMGQGAGTTLRKIVSTTLGLPIHNIIYDNPDTDRVPDSGPTVASRTVMIVGELLRKAARRLEKPGEDEVLVEYEQPPHIEWDQELFQGDAYPVYSWGANAVEVEVDPDTYEIKVTGVWGAYDVGTPIDEMIVRGQIEGGISQGLGYATIEVMQSSGGKLKQGTLTDYILPTSMDFPDAESMLIENYYEYGPFGAKCAGELPFIGVAPALASAVGHALGISVGQVPVTPEYLMEAAEGGD